MHVTLKYVQALRRTRCPPRVLGVEAHLTIRYAAAVQDVLGDEVVLGAAILVVEIDDLADPRLHQGLGALMAREERHVNDGSGHVLEGAPVVENRVGLGMDDVVVLVMQRVVRRAPKENRRR